MLASRQTLTKPSTGFTISVWLKNLLHRKIAPLPNNTSGREQVRDMGEIQLYETWDDQIETRITRASMRMLLGFWSGIGLATVVFMMVVYL